MTDDLDPKLRELEVNLRRLKPLDVNPLSLWERAGVRGGELAKGDEALTLTLSQRERGRSFRRIAYLLGATATTILALVWLFPQNQPQSSKNTVIPAIPVIPAQAGIQTEDVLPLFLAPRLRGGDEEKFVAILASRSPSPTMRQQLAELLDEMNVAELPTVKPEYPVVEIVVQERQQTADGRQQQRFERTRWRYDEEMFMMF